MATQPPEKPRVKLIGEDGNAFAIIGRVRGALRKAGQQDRASEFAKRALESHSYDAVLQLAMEYCEVY